MVWFKHATDVPDDGFQERATITGCMFHFRLRTTAGQEYLWDLGIGGAGVIKLSKTRAINLIGPEPATLPN